MMMAKASVAIRRRNPNSFLSFTLQNKSHPVTTLSSKRTKLTEN
jgi:hypothetical protein